MADISQNDQEYFRSEVMRIGREMLDTTHGLTRNQKDQYAEYLISLAYTDKPDAAEDRCDTCKGVGHVNYESCLDCS